MMLGEDSTVGRYWEQVGKEASRRHITGVVFMGAHWEVDGDGVEIASNPGAGAVVKQPVAWVTPDKYVDYEVRAALLSSASLLQLFLSLCFRSIRRPSSPSAFKISSPLRESLQNSIRRSSGVSHIFQFQYAFFEYPLIAQRLPETLR